MKRTMLALVLLGSPAFAADGFITAEIYQADFDNARECRPIDAGRRLWEGEQAFYVQAWAGPDTDELDQENAVAMPREEVSMSDLAIYQDACR